METNNVKSNALEERKAAANVGKPAPKEKAPKAPKKVGAKKKSVRKTKTK